MTNGVRISRYLFTTSKEFQDKRKQVRIVEENATLYCRVGGIKVGRLSIRCDYLVAHLLSLSGPYIGEISILNAEIVGIAFQWKGNVGVASVCEDPVSVNPPFLRELDVIVDHRIRQQHS